MVVFVYSSFFPARQQHCKSTEEEFPLLSFALHCRNGKRTALRRQVMARKPTPRRSFSSCNIPWRHHHQQARFCSIEKDSAESLLRLAAAVVVVVALQHSPIRPAASLARVQ
ncbi:unnamed protein product [Sphagnum compactum]